MLYNAPNTVYYKEAKKLLAKGDQIITSYSSRIDDTNSHVTSPAERSATTTTSTSSSHRRSSSKGITSASLRRPSSAVATSGGIFINHIIYIIYIYIRNYQIQHVYTKE
jgi:hypothetical protein